MSRWNGKCDVCGKALDFKEMDYGMDCEVHRIQKGIRDEQPTAYTNLCKTCTPNKRDMKVIANSIRTHIIKQLRDRRL